MSIEQQLEQQGVTEPRRQLLLLVGLGWLAAALTQGLDSLALVAAARTLGSDSLRSLHIAGLLGTIGGALVAGHLADRYGRRWVLIGCWLIVALADVAMVLPIGLTSMVWLRGLTGLGLGGLVPVAATLAVEIAPVRQRALLIGLLGSTVGWGVLLALIVVTVATPRLGWWVGWLLAAAPAIGLYVRHAWLIESPRYLLRAGRASEALAALRQLATSASGTALRQAALSGRQLSLTALIVAPWSGPQRSRTVRSVVLWFLISLALTTLVGWPPGLQLVAIPTVSTLPVPLSLLGAYGLGAIGGGWLAERIGRRRLLFAALFTYGLAALVVGMLRLRATGVAVAAEPVALSLVVALLGAITATVLLVLTLELAPTDVRASQAGWAVAAGALGTLVGLLGLPWLLDPAGLRLDSQLVLVLLGIAFCLALLVASTIGPETNQRSLEDITAAEPLRSNRPSAQRWHG